MNVCFICGRPHSTNKGLLNHITLCHGTRKKYACAEEKCRRTFGLYRSFRRHRNSEHFIQVAHMIDVEPSVHKIGDEPSDIPVSFETSSNNDDELNDSRFLSVDNEPDDDDFQNVFPSMLSEDVMNCVAYLYSIPNIPRNQVGKILEVFSMLLNGKSFSKLDNIVLDRLSELGESEANISMFSKLFERRKSPFEEFDTEHKAKHKFLQRGTLIESQSVVIGRRPVYKKKKKGVIEAKLVPCLAEFVPMRSVLKKFLELPMVFSKIVSYVKSLESEVESGMVRNIIQGEYWKTLNLGPFNESEPIFPCGIYYDDFENNNPLGSHSSGKGKCGGIYFVLPVLPTDMVAKVENIFMFEVFRTMDRKHCTLSEIFHHVIKELNFLQRDGIKVNVTGKEINVRFKQCLVEGDNLGLHYVHGFFESFQAKYPCLNCFSHKEDFSKMFVQCDATLRTKEHYDNVFQVLRDGSDSLYGIKEESVFHQVHNFHIAKNRVVDIMHDFEEGVCRYDLGKVLSYFISKEYFTLAFLNDRIKGFDFGMHDKKSQPPPILEKHIKNKLVILSASEMRCLMQTLPLIIGDKIPEGDPNWKLFLRLRHILEIVHLKAVHRDTHVYLKTVISEYLQALVDLYPDDGVKVKHHHILHCPEVMKLMGPLSAFSSIRGESKHQSSKRYSKVCQSRVNLPKSLVIKNQYSLNYRFLRGESDVQIDDCIKIDFLSGPKIKNTENEVKYISYLGMEVDVGSVIVMFRDDASGYKFYWVKGIQLKNSTFIIVGEKLNVEYVEHYDSYSIVCRSEDPKTRIILPTDLECPSTAISFMVRLNSNHFICKKWP